MRRSNEIQKTVNSSNVAKRDRLQHQAATQPAYEMSQNGAQRNATQSDNIDKRVAYATKTHNYVGEVGMLRGGIEKSNE